MGGAWLLGGQVLIAAAQLIYSGYTSRVFDPSVFGAFSVAMAATGVVALVFSTGLPSHVLSARSIDDAGVTAVVGLSWLGGFTGAAVMVVLAPVWANAWRADESVPFTLALAAQVLLAAPAGVQMALLRREGRPAIDAVLQSVAAISGLIAGLLAIHAWRDPLLLVVSPTVAMLSLLVGGHVTRRVRYRLARPENVRELLRVVRLVSLQNLIFLLITSIPAWSVSVGASQDDLGYFSRAALITGMASYAFANAINRALGPFYRRLEGISRQLAITDSVVVASSIALPPFFVMGALAPWIVSLWLGQGWGESALLLPPMAVGYAYYVIFGAFANAAEMARCFRIVRVAQLCMALPAILLGGYAALSGDTFVAAWIIAGVALTGIAVLAPLMQRASHIDLGFVLWGITLQSIVACLTAVLALAAAAFFAEQGESVFVSLIGGAGVGLGIWFATVPLQPAWKILRRRKIL